MKNKIQIIIESRGKDLAGMPIERVLPWAKKRMVGPFIFLDHMGPAHFSKDLKMTVNAHPHIGLSTLTYLFEGRIHHRDSLGSSVIIIPGEVNWMTAGSGISHSEKTPYEDEGRAMTLHGLQFWVALPDHLEDCAPSFLNFKSHQIPKIHDEHSEMDVVVGEYGEHQSPVVPYSPVIFLNLRAKSDFHFNYQTKNNECALYLIHGAVSIDGVIYKNHEMIVFEKGTEISVEISQETHCVLIGGETFSKDKVIWWNFVSSTKEKIHHARDRWNAGDFPRVPNETEKILAPEAII